MIKHQAFIMSLMYMFTHGINLTIYSVSPNHPEAEPRGILLIKSVTCKDELLEIIKKPTFQKYWNITKDKCDVCKNCEYRYMCIDSRVPLSRNENEWYYKTECNYNPFIGSWKGELEYKSLIECGIVANENGFTIDRNKLELVNTEISNENELVQIKKQEALKKFIPSNGKVFIKIYADWCMPCKMINKTFLDLKSNQSNSGILFYDFDIDQYPEINEILEIDSIPFFASYYNGKLIEATCTTKNSKIESMISYLIDI